MSNKNTENTDDLSSLKSKLDKLRLTEQKPEGLLESPLVKTTGVGEEYGKSQYDENIPLDLLKTRSLENIRGEKQGWADEATNALIGGLAKIPLTVIGNVGSILDIEDYANRDNEVGNWLTNWAENVKQGIEDETKIYKSNDNSLSSREWWLNSGKGLIDSAGGFVFTGGILGKGIQLLSNLARTQKGAQIINAIGGITNAVALNQAESIPSAMNVYQKAYDIEFNRLQKDIDEGLITDLEAEEQAKIKAADAAAYSIAINRVNIPLNLTSAFAFLRSPKLTREIAKQVSKKDAVNKVLSEGTQEYIEENVNNIAENEALRKAKQGKNYSYNFNNTLNDVFSKQGFESGLIGFIGGAVQTAGTELVEDLKKDSPSYDNKGNIIRDETGLPILVSRTQSKNERFLAQKESLKRIENLAKSEGIPTVKEILNKTNKISNILNDIQIESINKNFDKVDDLKNDLLIEQSLDAFKNGTTENLINLYKSIANDPTSKEKLGEDYQNINKAISKIEEFEKIYQKYENSPKSEELFRNRVDYKNTLDKIEYLKTLQSKADFENKRELEITGFNSEELKESLETTKELKLVNNKIKEEVGKLIDLNNNFKNILSSKTVKSEGIKSETKENKENKENKETEKVKENIEDLSPRETDIYNNKTGEINNKLKDIKASEDKSDLFQTENLLNEAINGNNKVYSELANVLKNHYNLHKSVVTRMVDFLKDFFGTIANGNFGNNVIELVKNLGKDNIRVFLHESIHGITAEKLAIYGGSNPSRLTQKEINAIKELERIFEKVKKELLNLKNSRGNNIFSKTVTDGYYGFKDLHEFLAEAFTKREFQSLLSNIKGEGRKPNIFKQLLNAISDLLGLTDSTILEDIFALTEEFAGNNNQNSETKTKEPEVTKQEEQEKQEVERVEKEEKDYLDEDNEFLNTRVRVKYTNNINPSFSDYSKRKISINSIESGPDDGTDESSERYYRFTNKHSPKDLKGLLVTEKNNPKLFKEIMDLRPEAKEFLDNTDYDSGIHIVITDKNGNLIKSDQEGNINKDGKLVFGTITTIEAIENGRILIKDEDKASKIAELAKFRKTILDSTKDIYVDIDGRSNGHLQFENTIQGQRQSFSVIDRLGNIEDIDLELPRVGFKENPNESLLKNGKIGLTGKLYASNKEGTITTDLIPRLLTDNEISKVIDLILQDIGVKDKTIEEPRKELNKLIQYSIPKSGPKQFTIGRQEGVLNVGFTLENASTLKTEEGLNRLKEFLKYKRVNVNKDYDFDDRFTPLKTGNEELDKDVKEFNSYKEYLLSGDRPLFGTDVLPESKVQLRNQYYSYNNIIKEEKDLKNVNTPSKSQRRVLEKRIKSDIPTEEKLNRLKSKEQLKEEEKVSEQEKQWFKTNFPNIDYEETKGLIDGEALGQFISYGKVLLSDEATSGTLYHEAYHAIEELYLTDKEQRSLHNEVRRKKGLKDLLEIKEYLAEDFLNYKKSGKILKDQPVRNNLFRRILNYIKELLNLPVSSIEELYKRIDKGYYKEKPIRKRDLFVLNRSKIQAEKGVTFEKDVLDSFSYLFFDKLFKKGITPNEVKPIINRNIIDEVHDELIENYYNRFIDEQEELIKNDPDNKESIFDLEKKIKNIEYIYDNFEELTKRFIEKSNVKGVNINLKVKDEDFNFEERIDELEELEELEKIEASTQRDSAYQEANLSSPKSNLNDSVWSLISSLKQVDKLSDNTGLPKVVDADSTYNYLLKNLSGLLTYEEIFDKLNILSKDRPELKELIDKLGKPDPSISYEKIVFQEQFRQDFSKNRYTSYKTIMKDNDVFIIDANEENNSGKIIEKWKSNILARSSEQKDNKIIIDLNTISFKDNISFLNSIGFNLSKNTISNLKNSDNFIPAAIALQNYIKENNGDITTLFDFKEDKSGVKNNIKTIAEIEANNSPESTELSFFSSENKTIYSLGYNNTLSTIKNKINNSNTIEELYSVLPHLNTVTAEGSVYLSELFDSNGKKSKNRYLSIDLHDGLSSENDKLATRKLNTTDKYIQEIVSILKNGKSSYIRASDKSSEHIVSINSFGKNKKLYIPVEDLKSLDNKQLLKTFQGYFKSELKRIALFRVNEVGKNIATYNKTGGKFTVFEGILKSVKTEINKELSKIEELKPSKEETIRLIDELAPKFYDEVNKDVIDFFTKYSQEQLKNEFKEFGITLELLPKDLQKYSINQIANAIAVNDYINSIEQTKLFIGDLAFYKDLFKRTAGYTGVKQSADNGANINTWLNNNIKRKDKKIENGEIKVAIFKDVKQKLNEEYIKNYKETLEKSGLKESEINEILDSYNDINEGDAQGWITLDEYRSFLIRIGKDIPQNIFDKAQKGELLNKDELYYFTPLKAQYAGPQKYNDIFAPAYHKYSLFPLLPSVIKGTNLEVIADNMTNEQIGYALFESGSKVGTILDNNGEINKFYNETNYGNINTKNWTKQTVFYDFLGIQTETPDPKSKNIYGTQFRKLVFTDTYSNGNIVNSEFKNLLEKHNKLIDDIVNIEKSKLIEELGIDKNTIENIKKLVDLLQTEAKNRDLPDNIIDSIQEEIKEGKSMLKYKVDNMVNKNKVDSLLMSIINTRLIRQKITGDALIQVSSSGMEPKGKRKHGVNDSLKPYRVENGKVLPAQIKLAVSKDYRDFIEKNGGLEETNKLIKEGKIDKNLLEIIAYRIPTQGLNSMEYFEIVEFLPEESSTSIIVPTIITTKSGSDFDVDKLNIIRRSFKRDEKSKKENELMDICKKILSNPSNFEALIKPNSNKIIKDIANKVNFIEHLNEKPDNSLSRNNFESQEEFDKLYEEKEKNYIKSREESLGNILYSSQLKLSGKNGKISQFIKFLTAKDMVGIAALHNTHHILSQEYDLKMSNKHNINLNHNKTTEGNISLSNLKDNEGKNKISETISHILTSVVDAAKDPFILDINMTDETLNTYLYLVRSGVTFEDVAYFMSQPIISDYLKEISLNDSISIIKKKSKGTILKEIYKKYKNNKNKEPKILTKDILKGHLKKENQSKDDFYKDQIQILEDYIKYRNSANELSKSMRATNMDTAGVGKNLDSIIDKQELIKNVLLFNNVINTEKILKNSIVNTFNQLKFTRDIYSPLYNTQNEEFLYIKEQTKELFKVENNLENDKLNTLIENDLIQFVIENWGYKDSEKLKDYLFKSSEDIKSLSKRILDIKTKDNKNEVEEKLSNNLLIKELQPILSKFKKGSDNLKLYSKRYDTYKANQLTDAFREIQELDLNLAKDMMDLGILQSGLNNSPITYLGIIPFEYYNELVKNAFDNFYKKNGVEELSNFPELFKRENPDLLLNKKEYYNIESDILAEQMINIRPNKMYGKNYSLKSIEKENKSINNSDIQLKTNEKPRINEKLRIDVISKFHSTKEQALTAYNQIKDLLKGSYVHQVGDKWKVYAPVQKPRSNQFPQQSIPKNKEELPIEQFKEIVDKLYNKFGQKINYKIVEPEEILKYIEEQTGLNREDLQLSLDNTPAVYKDNTILYPKNYLTSEVAFHEFSHPFIDIIVKQNPDLFNNLKNELQTTDSGKLIIEKIKKEYPHLIDEDGSLTEGFWKESIVTALGELASNNLNESKDKGLISYLKDLLKQISQYLRDLFSTPTKVIKPFEIDPNTKLEELASMLNIDNQIDLKEFSSDEIKYGLKAINILQSEKAKNIFDKGNKNKWSLDRILTELQIPKEQKELLLSLNIKDREQLALELASNYSYTVEINTAKTNEEKQVIQRGDNEEFTFNGFIYEYKNGEYLKDDEIIDLIEYESAKHKAFTQPNTQHYSNLTVPGGTNYTENEIAIPGVEVQERPKGITTKKGVDFVFEQNPKLASIGTTGQYSQYLDTIFPDSKVKDIVYHGSSQFGFDKFSKEKLGEFTGSGSAKLGFFFSNNLENSFSAYTANVQKDVSFSDDGSVDGVEGTFGLSKIDSLIKDLDEGRSFVDSEIRNKEYLVKSVFKSGGISYGIPFKTKEEALENYKKDDWNYNPDAEVEVIENVNYGKYKYSKVDWLKDTPIVYYKEELGTNNKLSISEEEYNKALKNKKDSLLEGRKKYIKKQSGNRVYSILLNSKTLKEFDDKGNKWREETYVDRIQQTLSENKDGLVIKNTYDPLLNDVYVVFEPEQIHILGSKQDIEGFKNWINNNTKTVRKGAITPSIKGHAQFSTDNGIGWFRSDDLAAEYKGASKDYTDAELAEMAYDAQLSITEIQAAAKYSNKSKTDSKTRRILEVQSDLFQKGRDAYELIGNENDIIDELEKMGKPDSTNPDDIAEARKRLSTSNQNQFLQLLNKNNNWVTFFVKSIIQDSAKKGYEKILFPSGDTASKVEGHTTLEEFKREKENRIKQIEKNKNNLKIIGEKLKEKIELEKDWAGEEQYSVRDSNSKVYFAKTKKEVEQKIDEEVKTKQEQDNKEINQLKQELERVETEGFGALKPIYNFYENTVGNILKKQGYNPKLITDEYNNTWNEVIIDKKRDLSQIQLKKKDLKEEIEQKKKDRENINKSPYLKQYVYFKRRLAYLEKQQKSTKEDTPSFNILQEEINKIGEGIKKVTKDQDYNTYKKLADDTLDYVKQKIEDLVDTKDRKGRPITDDEIIDISDILDTFKNFKGTESLVKEYTEKLFPLIQDRATKVIQNYSTEKNKITKEDINNQNEDIGKFTKGVGSLSDSKNYIGRTIGSIIKEAQNRKSTRSKQLKSRIEKQIDNLNNWAKKNGVSLEKTYDLFIQPKENTTMLAQQYLSNGQLNPNFKIIVDNPELSEFYQFYQDTISELQKNQSIKFGKNFIPNLKKTEGIWNKIKELINVQTTSDTDFTSKESLYADVLPTKYTKRLDDKEKSRDLGAILMSYGKHIYNQEEMSDILPTIRLLQENLKYKLTPEGILTERSFKKSSDPKTEIFGSETNLNKMIEDVINMQVFGEMKDKELYFELGNTYDENGNITGRKYVHGSNIIDLALRYNSLLRIGFSPITAASNIIFGDVSNFIEGIGGQYFNLTQLKQASNIFIKQTLDKESVLNKVLIEELNILQDLEDYNQVTDVSLKSIKKLSTDKIIEYAYSMQKSGEKYLQSRPAIAVMIKDGYLSPKGELTDKYKDATDKEKAQLVDKIQRVNQMIHGRYTQQEAATLQQSVLYRLISQFKKWLPTAIENRIGERKYDNRLQTETEGRYVTIGRLLVNFNDTYDRVKSGNLSELEIANLKKTLTELTLFTATYLALGALKGDDEESKKLRKNWAVKTGLTLLNRVSGDISYFFDPSQISNTSKNLVPLVRTMDDLRLAISYLPSAFGEEGVYKKGSRKGQNKALTKFASIIPGPNQFYQLKRLANKQELEEFTK